MSDEQTSNQSGPVGQVHTTAQVAGAPGLAFVRWIDVEELNQWWWPMFGDTQYQVDPQPGGSYRFRTIEGGFAVFGDYTVVEPGSRLEFSWQWTNLVNREWVNDGGVDTIVVEFTDQGDGHTWVSLTHTTSLAGVEDYVAGWQDVLSRLGVVQSSTGSTQP